MDYWARKVYETFEKRAPGPLAWQREDQDGTKPCQIEVSIASTVTIMALGNSRKKEKPNNVTFGLKSVIRWPYARDFELWLAFTGAFERFQTAQPLGHTRYADLFLRYPSLWETARILNFEFWSLVSLNEGRKCKNPRALEANRSIWHKLQRKDKYR